MGNISEFDKTWAGRSSNKRSYYLHKDWSLVDVGRFVWKRGFVIIIVVLLETKKWWSLEDGDLGDMILLWNKREYNRF